MKKITLLAVAFVAVTFASCRKTHDCVCTDSTTGSTTTISLPKQTSSAAKTSCDFYSGGGETCVIK